MPSTNGQFPEYARGRRGTQWTQGETTGGKKRRENMKNRHATDSNCTASGFHPEYKPPSPLPGKEELPPMQLGVRDTRQLINCRKAPVDPAGFPETSCVGLRPFGVGD